MSGKIVAFPNMSQDTKEGKRKRGARSDGRVQRSWQFEKLENGERVRVFFYGKSGAEADRKMEAFKKAYYAEKEAIEKKNREIEELGAMAKYLGVTVSAWLDIWKEKYKGDFKSIITETGYDSAIKRINKHIGDMKLEDVRDIHIQAIFRELSDKSKSLISKTNRILYNAFAKAVKNRLIRDNPLEDFDLPIGKEGTHRALESWECDFIIENWQEHKSFRWATVMILSGVRTGEFAAIDVDDIQIDNRVIEIDDSVSFGKNQPERKGTTKTKSGIRTVPICDLLLEVISYSIGQVNKGPLFLMDNNQPLTKIGIRRAFDYLNRHLERYAKEKGYNYIKVRPHDCRHTYATALYDAGVDVKTAQYLLGHSNIHTTLQLYTHLSHQKMKEGVGHIVSYLNKWVTDIPGSDLE